MKHRLLQPLSYFVFLVKKCQYLFFAHSTKFVVALSLFVVLAGSTSACGSSRGSGRQTKTIKKGKPIPCPQKDC
jgi:hypothetical protein